MFGTPLEDLDFAAIVTFLETGVRERFVLDLKRDFPSDLGKTLAAFANTYGGIVLIGVEESSTGAAQLPVRGVELKPGLRERVLQIALDTVYPPVLPEVRVIDFKSDGGLSEPDRAVVVIRVNESENPPHAVEDRTAVYLRVDNISKRIERKATIGEIEWLTNKRQRSLDEKTRILQAADRRAIGARTTRRNRRQGEQYCRKGAMRLWTVPTFPRSPIVTPGELKTIVGENHIQVNTGIHFLPQGDVRRVAEGILYLGSYGSSEFQQQGLILHEYDYWWDYHGPSVSSNAKWLSPRATAALLLGVLKLSLRVYRNAGYSGLLDFRFEADDLEECGFVDSDRGFGYDFHKMVEPDVAVERRFTTSELGDRITEIATECLRELYWAFGTDANDSRLAMDFQDY
jgi:hypothetical protein